jgi:hypothetical protein
VQKLSLKIDRLENISLVIFHHVEVTVFSERRCVATKVEHEGITSDMNICICSYDRLLEHIHIIQVFFFGKAALCCASSYISIFLRAVFIFESGVPTVCRIKRELSIILSIVLRPSFITSTTHRKICTLPCFRLEALSMPANDVAVVAI